MDGHKCGLPKGSVLYPKNLTKLNYTQRLQGKVDGRGSDPPNRKSNGLTKPKAKNVNGREEEVNRSQPYSGAGRCPWKQGGVLQISQRKMGHGGSNEYGKT